MTNRNFNCPTNTGSPRTWHGERLIAERRKGLHRKIIIKVTSSRNVNIKNQMERFISATVVLCVGVQRRISDIEEFRFKNQTLQLGAAPGCPSRDKPVSHCSLFSPALNGFHLPGLRNPNTLPEKYLGAHMKGGFASLSVREWGWLTVGYSSSMCLMISIWEGKSSHRSALPQSRASGRPSVVSQIQCTGSNFEVIIAKSFLSFFRLPKEQKGRILSSRKHLIPIDISGNKALKYLGKQAVRLSLLECVCVKQSPQRCLFGKVISDTHHQGLLKQAQHLSGL